MQDILKNAPYCSYLENNDSIRFDSLNNLISDVAHEIYVIKEDELVEEAKDEWKLAKRYKARPFTIASLKNTYKEYQKDYKQLKRYLKYLKGVK